MGAFEATAFEPTAFYVPEDEEPPVVATGSPRKSAVKLTVPPRDDEDAIDAIAALLLEPF